MGVLVGEELSARLTADLGDRLYVIPILDNEQIQQSGVDLRLGNQFIVARNAVMGELDPSKWYGAKAQVLKYQERVVIPFLSGRPFVLHPGQLVLGSTFE